MSAKPSPPISGRPRFFAGLPVALLSAILVLLTPACGGSRERRGDVRPPNIVLVMFDDMGYEGMAAFDRMRDGWTTPILTPHLDALAARGRRFTRYYAAAPVCSPTRVSMLTGGYPQRINVRKQLPLTGTARGIPSTTTTLPELLRRVGYRTAHFGKWHVGLDKPQHRPGGVGFDESVLLKTLRYNDPILRFDGEESRRAEGHSTELLMDRAGDFIRRHHDRPFFVNLWLWAPHSPSQAPGDDWPSFANFSYYRDELGMRQHDAEYAAIVTNADHRIGGLLAVLEELELADDTIVVVTSDNGAMPRGGIVVNGALRGYKGSLFEGGSRVPLIVRWPGRTAPGTVDDTLLVSFDLVPTLAQAAGIDLRGQAGLDGRSFLDLLRRDPPTGRGASRHEVLVWEVTPCNAFLPTWLESHPEGRWNDFAVHRGRFKLVYQAMTDDPETPGPRCEDPAGSPAWHLFDLGKDPLEASNLLAAQPARARRLYRDYLDWRSRITLLPFDVDDRVGEVEVRGRDVDLRGGYLRLVATDLDDFNDGSFSFTARIRPERRGRQILAQRSGAWTLGLTDDGRVELILVDERGHDVTLSGGAALPLGTSTRVSVSIFGIKNGPAVARIFQGTELVAEDRTRLLAVARRSKAAVHLGGTSAHGNERFRGAVHGVELRVASLMADEIELLEGRDPAAALFRQGDRRPPSEPPRSQLR